MFILGITGGIASGKSTIARMIVQRGAVHVDADRIVHDLLARDVAVHAAIAAVFPTAMQGGRVVRRLLGAAIAGDPVQLHRLEQILHPAVRRAEEKAIARARRQRRRLLVLDVPLLFETGTDILCDKVLVAHAPLALRRRRALGRRGMTEAVFSRLVARQLSEAERCARADGMVPTTIGKAHTRRILARFLRQWGM